ncbi:TetR/AcrR family transcriptional regulator [Streptomyces sp. T028]|uniref:TetR/AcrR family transcriptional regulator n=1 Tax=Streptomyces sp. T028 TaxID=3394379 RepID=UPI003A8369BC
MTRLSVAERRNLLLDAASRVIARDGLAEASTRAITDEAGMPRGMFHYCFTSKDELLEQLIRHHVTDMVEAACATWDGTRDLTDNLRAGLRAVLGIGMADTDVQLLSYELLVHALRGTETASIASHEYADYARQASEYLQFVADKAGVRWTVSQPALARLFSVVIDGSMLNWLADRDSETATASLDAFAVMLTSLTAPVDGGPVERPE